ncbi:MAG TPA: phosphoribosylformylglycinamidine cyclo-ligase [Phycisphaerae bacterium]|nr:phosphoribosylformylglycinamidine cyclo-ligase [Phycisphaerae bacterium]
MVPEEKTSPSITYKQTGVDIEAGQKVVDLIRPMVKRTRTARVMGGLGGFAGMFRLDFNEKLFKQNYRDPVLVACTDSVGTKMLVAIRMKKLDTIGIDCVAMNVNDMICCGSEPLFLVDYLAVNKVVPTQVADIIRGVTEGCIQSGCALLGGETCEMPDVYRPGDFDIAGFALGVVERKRIIDGSGVESGDVAIALASDGLHSNGYGLARRVLLDIAGYKLTERPAELDGRSVGEELLRPTRIYVKSVLDVLKQYKVKRVVKAMAHITGGGLPDNLPRVLPPGLTVRIKRSSWQVPPIFKLIARKGPVDQIEMSRVFNMGVGFVMIVAPDFARSIMNRLRRSGERCWVLGKVRRGGGELLWS